MDGRLKATAEASTESTQQNAAMVEETSAAARNLMNEVKSLADQAGRFRFHGAEGASLAERPAFPAPAAAPARKEPASLRPVAAKAPTLPRAAKEGAYRSPVKPLPAADLGALLRGSDEDWKDF